MIKKFVKIALIILGLAVVALGGLIVWQWDAISIFTGNQNLHGAVSDVPRTPKTPKKLKIKKGDADWIAWRGGRNHGRSTMKGIPTDWSKGLKKNWEINFLCQGDASAAWSTPVVQGGLIIVTGRTNKEDVIFCLSAKDGSLYWRASYEAVAGKSYGSGPRATPWIDDDRVFTFGRSGDLICWDLETGKKIWHENVNTEGGKGPQWGHSASPLITNQYVVVSAGGSALIIAYKKKDGKVAWKAGTGPAGYAAITEMPIGKKNAALVFHGKGLTAFDLKNGKQLWTTEWITPYDVNATTPVFEGEQLFVTSGYGRGCAMLNVTETAAKKAWESKVIASHHTDPYIIDGHIYGYSGQSMQNKGSFKCVELKTGTEKWSTNEMGWGTCIQVEDHILCLDIKGNLYLMKPTPQSFTKVAEMPSALGEVTGAAWTAPVVANGKLYLRLKQRLVCYEFMK